MAWLAEVSAPPTEPLGDRAAEPALVFDEFCSMYLAILLASVCSPFFGVVVSFIVWHLRVDSDL